MAEEVTKVVAEVKRRISAHLAKERASHPDMPLDDEKKLWNGLVVMIRLDSSFMGISRRFWPI